MKLEFIEFAFSKMGKLKFKEYFLSVVNDVNSLDITKGVI